MTGRGREFGRGILNAKFSFMCTSQQSSISSKEFNMLYTLGLPNGNALLAISRINNSEFPILNISFRQVWGVSHKELSSFLLATIYTFRAAQLPKKYETTIDSSIH